jgi:hypothetical protein
LPRVPLKIFGRYRPVFGLFFASHRTAHEKNKQSFFPGEKAQMGAIDRK